MRTLEPSDVPVLFERYDPAVGPTPSSVVCDILQALNHCGLLTPAKRRQTRKLLAEKTALEFDPERLQHALAYLGLDDE